MKWHRHGDLNAANILVDLRLQAWLIDFATSGVGIAFDDCSKLVACILLEYQFSGGNNGADCDYIAAQNLAYAKTVVDAFVPIDGVTELWDTQSP